MNQLTVPGQKLKLTPFGVFKLESGLMRISDPCYNKDDECVGLVEAKKGFWAAYVANEDQCRPSHLLVFHQSYNPEDFTSATLTLLDFEAGVDSGQCGFYDDEFYNCFEDQAYREVCDITLGGDLYYQNQMIQTKRRLGGDKKAEAYYQGLLDHEDCDPLNRKVIEEWLSQSQASNELTAEDLQIESDYLEHPRAGIVDCLGHSGYGVVSSTAHGDGGYQVFAIHDPAGEVVGLMLDYIYSFDPEAEDDEEDSWEEEDVPVDGR